MDGIQSRQVFESIIATLSDYLYDLMREIPSKIKDEAREIRIRKNCPILICTGTNHYFVSGKGEVKNDWTENLILVSSRDIEESFQKICSYSLYSHQAEIKNGYVTLKGGHRVGICGTAVITENSVTSIRDISSLNIRIARDLNHVSRELLQALGKQYKGILIAGEPACGKTTLLRDLARQISCDISGVMEKVSVIDERMEISGGYSKSQGYALGLCDVLTGYPKGEGIMQAIRSLSPSVIICDEIGNRRDTQSILEGVNAGVGIIASIHASSLEELLHREQARILLESGAFKRVVLLEGRKNPGKIKKIYEVSDLYAKNSGICCTNNVRSLDGIHHIA